MKNISQLIIVADVSSDIISSQNIDDFSRIQTQYSLICVEVKNRIELGNKCYYGLREHLGLKV
jgi:hypothetical protein